MGLSLPLMILGSFLFMNANGIIRETAPLPKSMPMPPQQTIPMPPQRSIQTDPIALDARIVELERSLISVESNTRLARGSSDPSSQFSEDPVFQTAIKDVFTTGLDSTSFTAAASSRGFFSWIKKVISAVVNFVTNVVNTVIVVVKDTVKTVTAAIQTAMTKLRDLIIKVVDFAKGISQQILSAIQKICSLAKQISGGTGAGISYVISLANAIGGNFGNNLYNSAVGVANVNEYIESLIQKYCPQPEDGEIVRPRKPIFDIAF